MYMNLKVKPQIQEVKSNGMQGMKRQFHKKVGVSVLYFQSREDQVGRTGR
jgi:hypothetical protein